MGGGSVVGGGGSEVGGGGSVVGRGGSVVGGGSVVAGGGSVVDGGGVVGDGDSSVPSTTIGRYRVNWSNAFAFPPTISIKAKTIIILERWRVLFFITSTPFLVDEEKIE